MGPDRGFLQALFGGGPGLWGIHIVVGLSFVHAEPQRAGFPDRLAVDGPRGPFDAVEELLVRLSEAKEDVAAVGAADDGRVIGGGFARAFAFEGASDASEAVRRQGQRIGTEDQDGAWFGEAAQGPPLPEAR